MKKLLKLFDDNILRIGVALGFVFIVLYPKLPSIHIDRTWVYIRLEDFVILGLAAIWLIQLIRKKVSFPKPEGFVLIAYWIVGLITLIYCLLFIAPHLVNFFPKIAFLQYGRRIEYMILFFVAFGTIKKVKDVYFYLITLSSTMFAVILYGFGQKFYQALWHAFPLFFQKYPFCFPAFLTGNEEFAKGVPLCLNDTSRITSTFGGHYDLAAFLVFVIPVFIALFFAVKKVYLKILVALLGLFGLELLNFTSSRTSFAAYIIGVVAMLIFWKKKRWIIPVLAVSLAVMTLFGSATIQRFSKTIQQVQVVSANKELPADLKKIISDAKDIENNQKPEIPPPSDFTVGAASPTSSASGFSTVLTTAQLARLNNGDIAISSISGGFLIQKAYALDVSFTTRFQAEWPRNWKAFLASPLFGTGYSSLTLATDNDYLRALGETGLAGTIAFLFMFVIFGIFMKNVSPMIKDPVVKAFLFGLSGGIVGLLMNAILIDVFEASKVAEPMWILLGIGVGAASLFKTKAINYRQEILAFLTSRAMIVVYLFLLVAAAYMGSIANFFVADDFTWLHWAASANASDLLKYFINSENFFYRPLDKIVIYYLYEIFSFQPEGYHIFNIFLHFISTAVAYFLVAKLLKNKFLAFVTAVLFALHPAHTENLFWFSTLSINLSTVFMLSGLYTFALFREKQSKIAYVLSILATLLALTSYELAIVLPLLFLTFDIFIYSNTRVKLLVKTYIPYIFLVLLYVIMRFVTHSFTGGGDYSYNLIKLVPNTIGNFLGYLGLFVGTVPFLSIYDTMRATLSHQWIVVSVVLVLLVIAGFRFFFKSKKFAKLVTNQNVKMILFGLVFAVVALLPYLPLGNIATRYIYVASLGFSLSLVLCLYVVTNWIRPKRMQMAFIALVVLLLSAVYFVQNNNEMQKWQSAGKVTKQTLTYFRTKYASFRPDTKLYFINTPIKMNGVWVFPVGLVDGLWFIYRESTPQVYQQNSFGGANQSNLNDPEDTYIFQFNNGKIVEIK